MEHLALPKATKHFIIVPYGAPENQWYDNGSFLSYPSRKQWTKDDIHSKTGFTHKGTNENVEQFFQTWLFFGLLIDALGLGDVHVTTSQFLRQHSHTNFPAVDTSPLPSLLQQWIGNVKASGTAETVWSKVLPMLNTATEVLNRFCTDDDDDDRPLKEAKPTWPVRDEISTTMIAVLFSLRQVAEIACKDVKNSPIQRLTARSQILQRRIERKWCLADATTYISDMGIDGQYFFAASPSPQIEELDQHYRCTKDQCRSVIDEDFYVTRHAEPPWHEPGCNEEIMYGGQLGPERGQIDWVDAVCRILEKGATPVALWAKRYRTLWSVEYHDVGKRRPKYVAVSHVWADGMGHPGINALPECQLDRIQHLVEGLRWEGRPDAVTDGNSDGIGFWMDTLCIPQGTTDRIKECKKKAINNMRHVYQNAACVLVLDAWLQQIPSTAPMLDILARLYQSNWLKRLWTHQEGFLPNKVYIQFSDQALDLDYLSQQDNALQPDLEAQGRYLDFHHVTSEMLVTQYGFIKKAILADFQNNQDSWKIYPILAREMAGRRTTRASDETVCLATVLGLDVNSYQEITYDSDGETAKYRMVQFLGRMRTFHMGIIFNDYERLDIQGWRWAPKSLLHHRNGNLGYEDDRLSQVAKLPPPMNDRYGFEAHYPGFLIKFQNIVPSLRWLERACAVQCADQPIVDRYLVVELPPNTIYWTDLNDYAVILSRVPDDEKETCMCALGAYTALLEPDIYLVQHLAVAKVRLVREPPPRIDVVKARLLDKRTKWMVQ